MYCICCETVWNETGVFVTLCCFNRKEFEVKIDKFKKRFKDDMSPFLCACSDNHVSTINYLINVFGNRKQDSKETKLFDINDTGDGGRTALFFCCFNGNISLVSKIFETFGDSVDVNKCNDDGRSPFWIS